MKKKLASVLLATTMSVSMSTSAFANTLTDLNNQKNQLEDQQKTSQGKINDLQSKLDIVKAEIAALEKKLSAINATIAKTDQDIRDSQAKIVATDKAIEQTLNEIKAAEADLEKKKEILAKNVRLMYSKGETSYMEYLFSSADISDFLYRFDALKDVASANRKLYDKVREILNVLADKKEQLDNQRAEQVATKNKLLALQKTQQDQKAEQMKINAELHQKKESIEDKIADEQAAMNAIQSQAAAMARKIAAERKRLEDEAKQSGTKPPPSKPVGTGSYAFPVPTGSYYVSSGYGYRTHPITGQQKLHAGIDLAVAYGTPIYSVDNGTVLYAGPASGYGHWVVVDHGNGIYSVYGHMYGDQLYVSPGQTVKKGQKIAAAGSDGGSTGVHLHFGICDENFNYRNPASYIGL